MLTVANLSKIRAQTFFLEGGIWRHQGTDPTHYGHTQLLLRQDDESLAAAAFFLHLSIKAPAQASFHLPGFIRATAAAVTIPEASIASLCLCPSFPDSKFGHSLPFSFRGAQGNVTT